MAGNDGNKGGKNSKNIPKDSKDEGLRRGKGSKATKSNEAKSRKIADVYENYDAAFKDALSVFNDKVLDFFGLDLPPVKRVKETEFKEIYVQWDYMDFNFDLYDDSILHFEEEVDISENDLLRLCQYHLELYRRYKKRVRTVVLSVNEVKEANLCIRQEDLFYRIHVLDCSKKDADKTLGEIRKKIKSDEPVNELEVIFLPLYKSESIDKTGLLKNGLEIVRELKIEESLKQKMSALMLVLCNKIIEKEKLEEIWRELKMLKVIEFAEEKGIEQGIEQGIEKGIEQGIEKGELKQVVSLIRKKLAKNKSRDEIIAELELEGNQIDILDNYDKYKDLIAEATKILS